MGTMRNALPIIRLAFACKNDPGVSYQSKKVDEPRPMIDGKLFTGRDRHGRQSDGTSKRKAPN